MAEARPNTQPAPPAGQDRPSLPSKCVACHREMKAPVVCDYCHSLNPITAPTDYFQLLGLPRRFPIDAEELRRKYLALNRLVHPDFYAAGEEEGRELSLNVSAAVNNAYRILREPSSRAEYLLEVLGGKSSADDKSVPEGLLGEVMLLREAIEEAKAEGDQDSLAKTRRELQARLEAMIAHLGGLFEKFDETISCEATRLDELGRIRRLLNGISYVRRLLTGLDPSGKAPR